MKMATEIKVPELGESVMGATVGAWEVREGEPVKVGDVLVSLETDKVDVEVGAQASGVLARIERQSGEDVAVGDVLGLIEEDGRPPAKEQAPPPQQSQPPASPPAAEEPPAPASPPAAEEPRDGPAPAPNVTPVARRLALEKQVDLTQVGGTGGDGRITKGDVEAYLAGQRRPAEETAAPVVAEPAAPAAPVDERPAAPPAPPAPAAHGPGERPEERLPMSRRRRTIARRLLEAMQTTAMLTTFNEIDMGAVVELRKRRQESFTQRHGVRLGYSSFFVRATIGALKAFPRLNAEIQGEEIVLKRYYDIGIAVGAEEGLVVPVLRDADRLTMPEIERQIEELGRKVKERTITLEELRGGTFTITNGGVFGSLMSTPILNPPQVGILGLHRIMDRPVAVEGQVVIRPMMYVALSYDHRIVDGREAVQFLVRLKELVEAPELLLLEG
jgi:2-oxoglutarate dehydrogenase E2 component (dihydrolipoamide succinyltransferase)